MLSLERLLRIYIPTLRRINKQRCWDRLPDALRKITYLVCPLDEKKEHVAAGRQVLPCSERGIQNVRQWILDQNAAPMVFMLDDDLQFYRRKEPGKWNLRNPIDRDEVLQMFQLVVRLLQNGYVHVGVTDRFMNHRYEQVPYAMIGRQCMAYGFQVAAMRNLGVRFRERLMSDFDVALQFLKLGYANPMLTDWCVGQPRSQAVGGCSTYRNNQLLYESAQILRKRYHPYISTVTSDASWGDLGEHANVQVEWLRLWGSAHYHHGDTMDPVFMQLCKKYPARPLPLWETKAPMLMHEVLGHAALRTSEYSKERWQKSLLDKEVLCRWTAQKKK